MMKPFGDRLRDACSEKGSHLCAGLDPRPANFPKQFSITAPGDNTQTAKSLAAFCIAVIDLIHDQVAVVKPQIAFFEAYGAAGLDSFWQVSAHAQKRGLLVIADAKRGDIDSTAEAYAKAFFDPPLGAIDALTVNPYMGMDTLLPFVSASESKGCGLFVLVKTSNPGSADFQDLVVDGRPLYEHVAERLEALSLKGQFQNYSNIGAVVGATHPQLLNRLRHLMPHSWLLVPGVGAQGADMSDTRAAFDASGTGALINISRVLTYPWLPHTRQPNHHTWQEDIRSAAVRWNVELNRILGR